MRLIGSIWVLLIILVLPSLLWAADEQQLDDILSGFEDEAPPAADQDIDDIMEGFEDEAKAQDKVPAKAPSPIGLNGHLKLGTSYNFAHKAPDADETDWRGLSRLKTELGLEMQIKWHDHWRLLAGGKFFYDWAYRLQGRDHYSDEVLEQYEEEAELGEAYLQGRLHRNIDLKAGRQILVWGRSDNIRITDVLNPLDFREPGLVDIEDLRLPIAMTRLDGYWSSWNLTAIAGHEIRFNKNPAFGHDFFPGDAPLPPEEKPSSGGDHTEWALALNGIFSGKDLSLYYADIHDENTHTETTAAATLVRKHARVTMWGAAGSLVFGDWLLIGECAYWQNKKFFHAPGRTFDRLDGLVGIEYSGWTDTSISLDWAVRHILNFDSRTEEAPDYAQENAVETALRISQNYLSDTLEITLLAILYGSVGKDGALERLSISYDWNDALSTTFGVALYQSGDSYRLSDIGDNDRIYAEIKYSF